ncbi:unnamed protein product [Prorocentrum cordatum]|uniref:Uncharacterized protein n=1 Tax=Prorocentrum cordatum TaxID=2364126 RepID=A0ABN9TLI2_9DINO|nr:unnamed protein product [Polarella glacialis]
MAAASLGQPALLVPTFPSWPGAAASGMSERVPLQSSARPFAPDTLVEQLGAGMVVRIGEGPEDVEEGVVAAPATQAPVIAAESVVEQALEHATAVEAAEEPPSMALALDVDTAVELPLAADIPVPKGDEAELVAEPPVTGAGALVVELVVEALVLALAHALAVKLVELFAGPPVMELKLVVVELVVVELVMELELVMEP